LQVAWLQVAVVGGWDNHIFQYNGSCVRVQGNREVQTGHSPRSSPAGNGFKPAMRFGLSETLRGIKSPVQDLEVFSTMEP
jgi:hypothetical protein